MRRAKRQPSTRERAVSWLIMGVLVLISVGLLVEQSRYDPGTLITAVPGSEETGPSGPQASPAQDLSRFMPLEMHVVSPLESFDSESLSEKINGKAELYLAAGFIGLRAQRFALAGDSSSWMEVFIYHMGTLRQAFAVFSVQRRDRTTPLDLTSYSYGTANAVYFVHGPHYVEIISSSVSRELMDGILSFGKAFVEKTPVEKESIEEIALFPRQGLDPGGARLFVSNAFGFDGLSNVFTARYIVAGEPVTGFLSPKETPGEAERLARAYESFLVSLDGMVVPMTEPLPNAVLIDVFGRYELIFHHDRVLAGVHDAASRSGAEKLGRVIRESLEASPWQSF